MKLYMAPLQSYTTAFYRRAHANCFDAMDKYFTPFFEENAKGIKNLQLEPELSPALNKGLSCIPQVATNQGPFLSSFAQKAKQLGYSEININMGCPFPMLTKRQRGGGILKYPELVKAMLDDFFEQDTGIALSVKMRLGTDSPQQGKAIVQLLNNYPIEELIIHPRLVTQKYDGLPDWKAFSELYQSSQHRIIANGDINTPDEAYTLMQRFPDVEGMMLGRGLLSDPQLPLLIKGEAPKPDALFDLHNHYFKLINNYYNDWNRSFNFLLTYWYYPLQANLALKRLYRQLKKHNKPNSYQTWLSNVKDTIL